MTTNISNGRRLDKTRWEIPTPETCEQKRVYTISLPSSVEEIVPVEWTPKYTKMVITSKQNDVYVYDCKTDVIDQVELPNNFVPYQVDLYDERFISISPISEPFTPIIIDISSSPFRVINLVDIDPGWFLCWTCSKDMNTLAIFFAGPQYVNHPLEDEHKCPAKMYFLDTKTFAHAKIMDLIGDNHMCEFGRKFITINETFSIANPTYWTQLELSTHINPDLAGVVCEILCPMLQNKINDQPPHNRGSASPEPHAP